MTLVRLINDHVLLITEFCKVNVSWKVSQCGKHWSSASSSDEMADMLSTSQCRR